MSDENKKNVEKEKTFENNIKISDPKKAAILMMVMGEDYTAEIFEKISQSEINSLVLEMSSIDQITPEELNSVAEEFVQKFENEARLFIESGIFVSNVVKKVLGDENANAFLNDLAKKQQDMPFSWSKNINVKVLSSYMEGEHPQTIAMILAHMPPEISSEILMSLPEKTKGEIALRIAKLGQISDEVIRDVDRALKYELSGAVGQAAKAGGLEVLVDIINGVDKSTEDSIMDFVEEDDLPLANELRDLMFVFDDLINIEDEAIREILKQVEGQNLVYALRTASEEMKEKIFSNLSQRAGEMIKDDLENLGPVRLTEVEEAQQSIVRTAKELETTGTIVLRKGNDDVLV